MIFDFVDLGAKDPGRELRFSEKMACPNDHPIDIDELEPRSFSFNSPFGACPDCHGLGTRMEVDPELVVPDPTATLGEGAIQPWSQAHVADYFLRLMDALGDELGFDLNTPWEDLADQGAAVVARRPLDQGPRRLPATATAASAPTTPSSRASSPYIERRHREAESDTSRERFEGFMREVPCPACGGSRLKPVSLAVTLGDRDSGGKNIAEVCALPISETADFLRYARAEPRASGRSPSGCSRRSTSGSASCSTSASTTSPSTGPRARCRGGEAQRIRLATQIGAGLVGVLYVLDEPSIGLHQRDNHRLIETLRAAQRPRQHPDRRRARRGHHPQRRLGRRHRPGRRRARRPGRRLRHGRRTCSTTPTR